ncbi:MAG TPA: 2-hydroxyacyl-CoA dehydratase [Candidatus Limnocylindria bacterium]|nr:2-hydroxyacyl-CoA dehydratase [Candidatus Limnocylindria bacterium]
MTVVETRTFERFRDVIEDRSFPTVRAWRERTGRKAVGCFPVYAPVEVAYAAGMLPVGVFGGGNRVEIANADSRFQSFICSIVKSTLELGFVGALDPFDAMMFHSICDPARNLASVMQRNFPARHVVYVHLPQNMASPSAVTYLAGELRRVASELGDVAGRTVTDDDLARATLAYDEVRALLRELYALRSRAPERLATAELYTLARLATLMDPADVAPILGEALAEAEARAERPKDRVRTVLVGSFCEQPPLELIESLEAAGCYLVDDDLLQGWRPFLGHVAAGGDPFAALARSYLDGSAHLSTKHDLRRPRAQALIETIDRTKADAVIFLGAKFCEPGLFDYALYRTALEKHGTPHLFLEFEEKMWLYDRIRAEVETFVESMLFR